MTNIKVQEQQKPVVQLIPVNIIIGTGCRKGTDPEALTVFIKDELGKLNIDERSVSAITSIDIKKEEPAITAAAEHFTAGQLFFSAEQIKEVEHLFQQSEFVREKTGAGCVAEPCAYLASGRSGKLILPRTKRQGMTISIMEKPFQEIE
jgi:cobalt-precorrin 5A hydrolase